MIILSSFNVRLGACCRKQFHDSDESQRRYVNYFKDWSLAENKPNHSYKDCAECPRSARDYFLLKSVNAAENVRRTGKRQADRKRTPPGRKQLELLEAWDLTPPKTPTPAKIVKTKTLTLKRKIIREEIKADVRSRQRRDLYALYTSNQSGRSWDRQRRGQFFTYIQHPVRRHISSLNTYDIDELKLRQLLGPERDLGSSMNGKWRSLARNINLRDKNGKTYNQFNSTQVLVEWAKHHGYAITQRTVKRRSYVRTKSNVPGFRTTSAQAIRKLKQELIRTKEINVGRKFNPVKPITVIKLDRDGQFKNVNRENPARVIDLNYIIKTHLNVMKIKGVLRKTDPSDYTTMELKTLLESKGSK
jgi:hypothetical protein